MPSSHPPSCKSHKTTASVSFVGQMLQQSFYCLRVWIFYKMGWNNFWRSINYQFHEIFHQFSYYLSTNNQIILKYVVQKDRYKKWLCIFLKFIIFWKATKIWRNLPVDLISTYQTSKQMWDSIFFVAFSEFMKFLEGVPTHCESESGRST